MILIKTLHLTAVLEGGNGAGLPPVLRVLETGAKYTALAAAVEGFTVCDVSPGEYQGLVASGFRLPLAGRARSERGASTLMVALLLPVLLGFLGLVVDTGVPLVARAQLQNAADAGALAAAITLDLDTCGGCGADACVWVWPCPPCGFRACAQCGTVPDLSDVRGDAERAARRIVAENPVMGQTPTITAITFGGMGVCALIPDHPLTARVDVQAEIPTFIMTIVGAPPSHIWRATATATATWTPDKTRSELRPVRLIR